MLELPRRELPRDVAFARPAQNSRPGSLFLDLVFNAGYLLGQLILADRYWIYWLLKATYRVFVADTCVISRPDWPSKRLTVEGYAHSANSFLYGNVLEPDSVISLTHRSWTIRESLEHNIPTVVLLRQPRDCMISKYRRSRLGLNGNRHPLHAAVILATWYLYYAHIYRHRRRVWLLPFEDAVGEYDQVHLFLTRLSGVHYRLEPSQAFRNALDVADGTNAQIELSPLAAFVLQRAQALHVKLLRNGRLWRSRETAYVKPSINPIW